VIVRAASLAYVAQEPMIMNASLRENVIFGAGDLDNDAVMKEYSEALVSAALGPDLEVLPGGDEVEIGEKGITLSGGQKARVALARAVFASRPGGLVLLDDPLAAVDAQVGAHLFEQCICGTLKHTTRILVTNQLQFLGHPEVARILVVEEGRIAEEGRFEELKARPDGRLAKMLASLGVAEQRYDAAEAKAGDARDGAEMLAHHKTAPLAKEWGQCGAVLAMLPAEAADNEISGGSFAPRKFSFWHLGQCCALSPFFSSIDLLGQWHSKKGIMAARAGARSTEATVPDEVAASSPYLKKSLTEEERKEVGAVRAATFVFYFRNLGGLCVFVALFLCSWGFHLGEIIPDMIMALWQEDVLQRPQAWYVVFWLTGCSVAVMTNVSSRLAWVVATTRASKRIHQAMLSQVMHCTMSFFDRVPSGRIMNRMGEDMMGVDFTAAFGLEVLCLVLWMGIDIAAIVSATAPLVIPYLVALAACFICVREVHRRTAREAVRWFMISKSPVFHVFEETLSGVPTICAFQRQGFFRHRFVVALSKNLSWGITKEATNHWTNQRLGFLGSLVVLGLSLLLMLLPGRVSASFGALAIIYALAMGETLKNIAYFLVMCETSFSSVERCQEFAEQLEQEPPWQRPHDAELEAAAWPGTATCELVFEAVSLRYLSHMPCALDCLSFRLRPLEKLGIVGRTGSGKSTIMSALLRLFPLEGGRVLLGGVDTAEVGLGLLRRRITIVPQDPILFSGELRRNLDPLESLGDAEIWSGLRRCGLAELVEGLPGGLGASVSEGGGNFSLGERQVLCLSRALMRGTCLLCLDEATANVDPANDARIQRVLSEEVSDMLVLTIAHRLHTVIHSDRILVLDKGCLAQLDTPAALLAKPGLFKELAEKAGILEPQSPVQSPPDLAIAA